MLVIMPTFLENLQDRHQITTIEDYLYIINRLIFDLLERTEIHYSTVDLPYIYDLIESSSDKSHKTIACKMKEAKKDYDYVFFSGINKGTSVQSSTLMEFVTRINLRVFTVVFTKEVEESTPYVSELMLSNFYSTDIYRPQKLLELQFDYTAEERKQEYERKFHRVFDFLLACNNRLQSSIINNYDEGGLDDFQ